MGGLQTILPYIMQGVGTIDAMSKQNKAGKQNVAQGDAMAAGYFGGKMFDENGMPIAPGFNMMDVGKGNIDAIKRQTEAGYGDLASYVNLANQWRRNTGAGMMGDMTAAMQGRQDDIIGGYEGLHGRTMGRLAKEGVAERRDIMNRGISRKAGIDQRMTDLGMGGTTVGSTLKTGADRATSQELGYLADRLSNRMTSADTSITGAKLGAKTGLSADVMNALGRENAYNMQTGEGQFQQHAALAEGKMRDLLNLSQQKHGFETNVMQNWLNTMDDTNFGYPDMGMLAQLSSGLGQASVQPLKAEKGGLFGLGGQAGPLGAAGGMGLDMLIAGAGGVTPIGLAASAALGGGIFSQF